MQTWAIIGIVVVAAIVAILVYAATKPNTLRVTRAANVGAAPEKIFAFINDYRNWQAWSPYEKKDPTMKRTLSGPPSGKGAVYAWEGNKNVGIGRMEILDSAAPSKVAIKLDFVKPFEAHNIVTFTLEPKGASTVVTWDMQGPSTFFAKVMGVFINMDRMVGRDFEIGLANLKALAEK